MNHVFTNTGSENRSSFLVPVRAQSPPAAPLAVVGWWDQRKTQEIFPTSIKPRLYLSSSGPAFHLSPGNPTPVPPSAKPLHPVEERWCV